MKKQLTNEEAKKQAKEIIENVNNLHKLNPTIGRETFWYLFNRGYYDKELGIKTKEVK